MSCYIANVVLVASEMVGRLDLRRHRSAVWLDPIPAVLFGLLSLLVVGLVKMKPWGRLLAIGLSGAVSIVGFLGYRTLIALGLWTLSAM